VEVEVGGMAIAMEDGGWREDGRRIDVGRYVNSESGLSEKIFKS
jgi:hypothetical protein